MFDNKLSFQLVLDEPKHQGLERDVGENVFLNDLKELYRVYLFYYPGAMPNQDLENALERLGNDAGTNLFVNKGKLNDPKYYKISRAFGIRNTPVIVMTGPEGVASIKSNGNNNFLTVYIRLDNKNLLSQVDSAIECIQRLFNLFVQGEILEALEQSQKDNAFLKRMIVNSLKGIGKFLWEKDIEVSLLEGKFSVKGRG